MPALGDLVVRVIGDTDSLDNALTKSEKRFKQTANTFTDYGKQLGDIDRLHQIFGKDIDVLGQKQEATRKQIEALINQGFKPESQEIQYLKNEYDKLTKEIDKNKGSQERLKNTMDSMTHIGRTMSVFVTAPILAAGVAAVKSAGDFQMYQSSFETMLGSASKAKILISDLQKLAAATPFKMDDLAQGAQVLLQYGINVDDLLPTIRSLGDVAQGNSERFNRLALAFGQTQSTGRLMGQDLLQMINSGFNPLKVISDKTGESMAELKDKMAKGGISARMVADAFKTATSEGGMFFNGMEKASKTLPGLMSTLSDDIGTLGRSFATILMPSIMDSVKKISELAKSFTDLDESTKKAILAGMGVLAVAGPLLVIIPKIVMAIKAMGTAFATSAGPIGLVVAGVTLLVAGIVKVIELSRQWKTDQELLNDGLKGTLVSADEYTKAIGLIDKKIAETNKMIEEQIMLEGINAEIWGGGAESYKKDLDILNGQRKTLTDNLKKQQKAETDLTVTVKDGGEKQLEIINTVNQKRLDWYLSLNEMSNVSTELELNNIQTLGLEEKEAYEEWKKLVDAKKLDDQSYYDGLIQLAEEAALAQSQAEADYFARSIEGLDAAIAERDAKSKAERDARIADWQTSSDAITSIMGNMTAIINSSQEDLAKNTAKGIIDTIGTIAKATKTEEGAIIGIVADIVNAIIDLVDSLVNAIEGSMEDVEADFRKVQKQMLEIQIQTMRDMLNNTLDRLDQEMNAAIKAAGVEEDTQQERLQERLDDINKELANVEDAGDKERLLEEKSETEKALKRQKIVDEYDKKKQDAEKKAQVEIAKAEVAKAILERDIALAQVEVDRATTLAQLGIFASTSQIANVNSLYDNLKDLIATTPIPSPIFMQEGGVVLPQPGGVLTRLAEAGQPEAVFPLDKLQSMISNMPTGGGGEGGMMHLIVKIDSKPILDQIFPASKNKTVLIDSGALV